MTISRLKKKLAKLTETHGITLDNDTASDIKAIMDAEEHRVKKDHGEGSFLRLFWQTQKEAASGPACGRRWHPMIIKWCIYLRHQSSKSYDTLRHTLALPSQRTLRDYTNCVKASAGFSKDVDKLLMQATKINTCEDWQKLVVLLLDEMHIKQDLVYDKHSGRVIGFCNLGEISNHLLQFERSIKGDTACGDSETLANSMMVIMVRGIFTPLRFPYVQFPCKKIKGSLMFHSFWETVYHLERMGIKVGNCLLDHVIAKLFVKGFGCNI